MADETPRVSLASLATGAAGEVFDATLASAIANCLDPNHPWKKPRRINLTLTLTPQGEARDVVGGSIEVKASLPGMNPYATVFYIGKKNGEVLAVSAIQHPIFPEQPAASPGVVSITAANKGGVR
jgi:hypothetical protein